MKDQAILNKKYKPEWNTVEIKIWVHGELRTWVFFPSWGFWHDPGGSCSVVYQWGSNEYHVRKH